MPQADLSDLLLTKRDRGNPNLRISDLGSIGRILIANEPGADIILELCPEDEELVIEKPDKRVLGATLLSRHLESLGTQPLIFAGVTTKFACRPECAKPMIAESTAKVHRS